MAKKKQSYEAQEKKNQTFTTKNPPKKTLACVGGKEEFMLTA